MRKGQSRESSIEAELTASEIGRLRARLLEALGDIKEFEKRLRDEETKLGITPVSSKPVVERMAAVGMPQEAIDMMSDMLDTLTEIALSYIGETLGRN
jgi:hypothetical protein